jgi:hypothetical protein
MPNTIFVQDAQEKKMRRCQAMKKASLLLENLEDTSVEISLTCTICNVTSNSPFQAYGHLKSQRHANAVKDSGLEMAGSRFGSKMYYPPPLLYIGARWWFVLKKQQ